MTRFAVLLCQIGFAASIAAIWEAASRFGWVDPQTLPPFTEVIGTLRSLLTDPDILSDLGFTAAEIGVAFLLAAPFGLICGFLIGESPRAREFLMPALQLVMAVPKAIFLPIFIFGFGIGFAQKVAFAVVLTVFVLVLVGVAAVQAVPRGLVTLSQSLGATKAQIYARIYLPAMAPLIVEGIRLALVFCIFGVLLAEMYGAQRGIGRATQAYAEIYRMREFMACVLLIVVLTVFLNEMLRWLQGHFSFAQEA